MLRAANGILYPDDLKFRKEKVEGDNERVENSDEEFLDGIEQTRLHSGNEYRTDVSDQRTQDLLTKTMHGEWFRGVSSFASQRTFDWVKKGYLDKRTEGFLFAAQEQALQTNWLKERWKGEDWDRTCRKCKEFPEKVSHIISGCSKLAGSEYRKRHDRMGLRVYWELCKNLGMKHGDKWYKETPDKVRVVKAEGVRSGGIGWWKHQKSLKQIDLI